MPIITVTKANAIPEKQAKVEPTCIVLKPGEGVKVQVDADGRPSLTLLRLAGPQGFANFTTFFNQKPKPTEPAKPTYQSTINYHRYY